MSYEGGCSSSLQSLFAGYCLGSKHYYGLCCTSSAEEEHRSLLSLKLATVAPCINNEVLLALNDTFETIFLCQ